MDLDHVTTDKYETELRDWYHGDDADKRGTIVSHGRISYAGIAASIGSAPHKMASVLEDLTGASFGNGRDVGRLLRTTHLAIQARVVTYLVGILVGIGENTAVIDGRNRLAVTLCQAITDILLNDTRFEDLGGTIRYIRSQRAYKQDDYVR